MKLNWKRAKSDLEQRSNRVEEEKPVILLVDDEELNLRLMGQLLEKYFKVYTAQSGLDAIKLLNIPNLSVIISDQRMPQMTGVELFRTCCPAGASRFAYPLNWLCRRSKRRTGDQCRSYLPLSRKSLYQKTPWSQPFERQYRFTSETSSFAMTSPH